MCLYIFTKINIEVKVFSKHLAFFIQGTDYSNYSLLRLLSLFLLFLNEMDSNAVINVIDVRISY